MKTIIKENDKKQSQLGSKKRNMCYYLTQESELFIIPKTADRQGQTQKDSGKE